jgi:Fe-S cluster assembly scaffold protein SufB
MKHLQILDKPGQKKEFSKSIVVNSGQKVNYETITNIISPNTTGNISIKAVVMENGSLTLKGLIKVSPKLNQVEAFLKHSILLIGKNSNAISIPELEIESNDVKVSHASTIGQIDSEQLFYLMSRGFSYTQSTKIIINSFLSSN